MGRHGSRGATRSRRAPRVVGFGGLPAGEQPAELGDVLKAPAASRLVEAELQRDVRRGLGRGQQGELLRGLVLGHATILLRGCEITPELG